MGEIMKKFAFIAVLGALAACTPEAETPTESAVEDTAAVITAADGGTPYGTFRITESDGKVFMEDIREDGTWTSTAADGAVTTGTWEQKSANLYCTTKDEEGAKQVCHEETIDENGVWTSTNPDDGTVVTVERVEA